MLSIASYFQSMTDEQAEQFSRVYRKRRKDANVTLVTAILGFLTIAGVHRFYLGQMGMGLLYLFTGGLCFIGTIVDTINYRQLTSQFNEEQATEVAALIRGAFPEDTGESDA